MLEQQSNPNFDVNDYTFVELRNKMIGSLSKFLSESITFFKTKCNSLRGRLLQMNDKHVNFVENQARLFEKANEFAS